VCPRAREIDRRRGRATGLISAVRIAAQKRTDGRTDGRTGFSIDESDSIIPITSSPSSSSGVVVRVVSPRYTDHPRLSRACYRRLLPLFRRGNRIVAFLGAGSFGGGVERRFLFFGSCSFWGEGIAKRPSRVFWVSFWGAFFFKLAL